MKNRSRIIRNSFLSIYLSATILAGTGCLAQPPRHNNRQATVKVANKFPVRQDLANLTNKLVSLGIQSGMQDRYNGEPPVLDGHFNLMSTMFRIVFVHVNHKPFEGSLAENPPSAPIIGLAAFST